MNPRTKKIKPGRPPLPADERKRRQIHVACTDAELKKIDALAKEHGLSRNAYMRYRLFGAVK